MCKKVPNKPYFAVFCNQSDFCLLKVPNGNKIEETFQKKHFEMAIFVAVHKSKNLVPTKTIVLLI